MTRQLDEMVKRNPIDAIPPENRDFSKIRDEDFENIRRSVVTNKSADVRIEVKGEVGHLGAGSSAGQHAGDRRGRLEQVRDHGRHQRSVLQPVSRC